MSAVLIALFVSLAGCLILIRYAHLHEHITGDTDLKGIQKFHASPVPRIGGLPIYIGIACALIPRWTNDATVALFATQLLGAAVPCFLVGLLEDLTKKIGAKERLLATMVSAAIAGWLLQAWLTNVQIFGVDWILSIPLISMIFTCFCIAGVAHSFNLIDGYHGLSGAVAVIILTALGYVAFQIKDYPIMVCSLAGIGAIVGFLFWNYPKGLIFLGDGGAYFSWLLDCGAFPVIGTAQP